MTATELESIRHTPGITQKQMALRLGWECILCNEGATR